MPELLHQTDAHEQDLNAVYTQSELNNTGLDVKCLHDRKPSTLAETQQYKNSLLWQVGLLELTNALDFPANIWNQIPTPLFAAVLMGVGGTIAILWSIFPFWDLHKSLQNIRLLRQERRLLKKWQQEHDDKDDLETRCLNQAWLNVNFRELGWEIADRVILDICAGISVVLVGIGAIMAIRGDIDTVYRASNLLSGYIGNSFLAPFALLNSFWAIFMWIRAGQQGKGPTNIQPELHAKLRQHTRRHRVYAIVNGLTAVVGCVGSIMSATLWYGYIVIAPCIFTSVYANILWRHQLGYDRPMMHRKEDFLKIHTRERLLALVSVNNALEAGRADQLPCFRSDEKLVTNVAVFLLQIGCYDEFCSALCNRTMPREKSITSLEPEVNIDSLASLESGIVTSTALSTLRLSQRALSYQERFYAELYIRYCQALEDEAVLSAPKDSS